MTQNKREIAAVLLSMFVVACDSNDGIDGTDTFLIDINQSADGNNGSEDINAGRDAAATESGNPINNAPVSDEDVGVNAGDNSSDPGSADTEGDDIGTNNTSDADTSGADQNTSGGDVNGDGSENSSPDQSESAEDDSSAHAIDDESPAEEPVDRPEETANEETANEETIDVDEDSEPVISVESHSSDSEESHGTSDASGYSHSSVEINDGEVTEMTIVADAENNYCGEVGDVFELSVTGVLIDPQHEFSMIDLTAFSTLDVESHSSVQILSHSDGELSLELTGTDIEELLFQYQEYLDKVYISAIDPAEHKPVILKKQYALNHCSIALFTDSGCAVLSSEPGTVTATVGDMSVTLDGCEWDLPDVRVVELE